MDRFEHSVQTRLRAEGQATEATARLRERVHHGLVPTSEPSPRRQWGTVALATAAVVTTLLVGSSVGRILSDGSRASDHPSTSPSTPAATTRTNDELAAATAQLLAASRAGDVPQITFVRNALDRRGLIVAVSQDTIDRFGTTQLEETFSQLVRIPTTIDVAEPPNDLLPILPNDSPSPS